MSRHSKNNTSGTVFTYHERQLLKNKGEWGTINHKLKEDSQKKFEQCYLCYNIASNPVCCSKGHLYCKECILDNLLNQKKEYDKYKKELKNQKINNNKESINKAIEESKLKEDKLKIYVDNAYSSMKDTKKIEKDFNDNSNINDINIEYNLEERIKSTNELEDNNINTNEFIPTALNNINKYEKCFWLTNSEDTVDTENYSKNKSSNKELCLNKKFHCVCPMFNHSLKIKELIRVNFKTRNLKAICPCCDIDIGYQKVYLLVNCGCIICNKCCHKIYEKELQLFNKDEEHKDFVCVSCSEKSSIIIKLTETKTGYSQSGNIMKKSYNPAFRF